jgi:hypothetical protein
MLACLAPLKREFDVDVIEFGPRSRRQRRCSSPVNSAIDGVPRTCTSVSHEARHGPLSVVVHIPLADLRDRAVGNEHGVARTVCEQFDRAGAVSGD